MKGIIRLSILCCFVLLTAVPAAQAQERGTIQAIATVVSGLRVTPMNNLNFETVLPGIRKTVDKTDVGFAGEWWVTGTASAELSIDFELPEYLYAIDSSASMLITFGPFDASYDDGTGGGQVAPAGILNPNGPSVQDIGVDGTITIWIGGAVWPAISQTGGDYSGDIILIVAYTGA